MTSRTLQIFNILAFVTVIVLNTLATTLPINGRSTGEISDMFPNLFVPAGYAFSIWSVIYLLLLVFIVLQSKNAFSKSKKTPEFVNTIGPWFFISCFANVFWILSWHYLIIPLSLLMMILLLSSLVIIYKKLNLQPSSTIPFLVRLPFSIYLGWITVATVANVTVLLVDMNWTGFGISDSGWTTAVIITASLIVGLFTWKYKDLAYLLVIFWAFIAITVKLNNDNIINTTMIVTTIYASLSILGLLYAGRQFLKSMKLN